MRLLFLLAAGAGLALGQDGSAGLWWMAGCFAGTNGSTVVEEQWSKPAGGQLIGTGRTIKNGRVVFHEFMRIEEKDGGLTFTPHIGSPEPLVVFTRIRQTVNEVVFENLKHDFPQRILYRRTPNGMTGRIEGTDKSGKPRFEDFPMSRTSCEAAPLRLAHLDDHLTPVRAFK